MQRQSGQTLPETMVALAIFAALGWVGLPALRAWHIRSQLVGVAEVFKGEFRKARSLAIRRNAYTALRFEEREDGVYLRVALDRDFDGVSTSDLNAGIDTWLDEGRRLSDIAEVRVGVLPGVPEPPPGRGMLDPGDPIRFGRSNMCSFSPLGGATPGTLYFAGHGLQAAVRVTGSSGRVSTLLWEGDQWRRR
jgi:type II secretory pathway pseudopilin PulG